jgi:translation initiation factor 4E
MQIDCFMLFRKGIRPEWEDPKNAQGGHLLYQIQFPKRALVDALWKNLFLDLIGESWTYSERVGLS